VPDYTLFGTTPGPADSATDGQPLNLAHQINTTAPCWAKGLRFYRGNLDITGTITGRLWTAAAPATGSAVPGTDVTFTLDGLGWHTALFPAPVELPVGSYKAAVRFPDRWPLTTGYWFTGGPGENGITSGPLTAPNATSSLDGQGSFSTGALTTYPATGASNRANYWVDLLVTDTDPEGGPEVADHTINADDFGIHAVTLTAASEDTFTFDTDLDQIEITNHGGIHPVYYTTDGTPATVAGRNTRILPAGWHTARVRPYTTGPTVVRVISAGTPTISVTRGT
jgi:hypothetical protein